jgi:hypothetical protein
MAITVTVNITDADQSILLNDLLDINAWVQAAVVGKVANSKTRMAEQASATLKADPSVSTMPATDDGLIEALLARDGYQNRAARDAAE